MTVSILDRIGATPLVELRSISRGLPLPVLAKCEHMSPGGSVEDRIAKAIVEDAESRGALLPGATRVEASAGNTDVGLAIVEQTAGRIGALVAGAGAGGTITGVARALRRVGCGARIVLADPVGSALADWVETGTLGPDGSYAVEGIGTAREPVVTVLPDGWDRYRSKPWMQAWSR